MFAPFLMLDDFRSNVPEHYLNGFPWHPHRGIETITYVVMNTNEELQTAFDEYNKGTFIKDSTS